MTLEESTAEMENVSPDLLSILADHEALVYHEARNVRFLIEGGYLPGNGWERLVSLPRNRDEAWRTIQPLREKAAKASSAHKALHVFVQRFGVSLENLAALYRNRGWRHVPLYGSSAWAQPTELVIKLACAIDKDDAAEAASLIAELREAKHNTGYVRDKLARLDQAL